MNAKLIDAGLDYLRITAIDPHAQNKMEEAYWKIDRSDAALGYKGHAAGMFGFRGRACRHSFIGDSEEWRMFQVSGCRAKDYAYLAAFDCKATRIDLQVTISYDGANVNQIIREKHDAALAAPAKEGRRPMVKGIMQNGAMQTVYIGSRSSEWYFRIYDKFAESSKEEYKNCVRFEIEIKGKAAKTLWKHIQAEQKGVAWLVGLLVAQFKARGVEIEGMGDWKEQDFVQPREKSSVERTMSWIRRAVAPSFKRMVIEIGWLQPLLEIVSGVLYDEEVTSLCRSMAIEWGG
jgi:DNA relaxase NicK